MLIKLLLKLGLGVHHDFLKLLLRYVSFTFVNLALASKPLSLYILVQICRPTLYQHTVRYCSLIVYVREFIVKMFIININNSTKISFNFVTNKRLQIFCKIRLTVHWGLKGVSIKRDLKVLCLKVLSFKVKIAKWTNHLLWKFQPKYHFYSKRGFFWQTILE